MEMNTTGPNSRYDELIDAVFAICDGEPSEEQIRRIDSLLAEDPAARLLYLQCLEIHLQMDRLAASRGEDSGFRVQGSDVRPSETKANSPKADIHPSSFILHPSTSLPSFFGGALFPYVVATLLIGLGLLLAWAWNAPLRQHDSPIARQMSPEATATAGPGSKPIGKVTKADHCTWWGHPSHSAKLGDPVTVGHKYALQTGALEITYDSGAVIILHGHCAYEINSFTSGVLYDGTAKISVATKSAAGDKAHAFVLNTPDFVFIDQHGDFEAAVQHMGGKQMTRMLNVSGKVMGRMSEEAIKGGFLVQFHAEPQKGGKTYCWEIIKETGGRPQPTGRAEDEEGRSPTGG
jgi:hypothetical protein